MLQMLLEETENQEMLRLQVPPQVALILSAMEAVANPAANRRSSPRHRYHVLARVRLFSDPKHARPWTIYTRDVHTRGLGFICRDRLPLGHGGLLHLPHPDGGLMSIHCTIYRCTQIAAGWYEGAINFNLEQTEFVRPLGEV